MSKISFIARQTSVKSTQVTIYVRHTHKGSSFAISTSVSVDKDLFNQKTGKVSSKLSNAPELNKSIADVCNDIERAARNVQGWGEEPIKEVIAKEYAAILKGRAVTAEAAPRIAKKLNSVIENLREQLAAAETEVMRIKNEIIEWELMTGQHKDKLFTVFIENYSKEAVITKGTSKSYLSVAADLRKFQALAKIEEINGKFLADYEKDMILRKHNNQTISTYISKIKTVYRYYAESQNLNPSNLDRFKLQTKKLKDTPVVYLSNAEMQALADLSLSTKSKEKVRDLMLLMCLTGLRYSDLQLKRENIVGNYIVLTTQKTNTLVKIPLNQQAKQIIEKYNYTIPKFRLQYFNRAIKNVCSLIPSMCEEIQVITSLSGTEKKEVAFPRYDCISAHAGRKTFATHSLAAGVNPATLQGWLGHSKIDMLFKHYANKQHNSAAEMDKVSASLPNLK